MSNDTEVSERTAVGRAAATRDRLLSAAIEAFGELGFAATTTRDIASRAGMSPAAVYVHHAGKEDLLFAISLDGHRRTLAVLQQAAAATDDPVAKLRHLVFDLSRWHADNSRVGRIVQFEVEALTPEHRAEIAGYRRGIEREYRAALEAGVAAGVMQVTDIKTTALSILSMSIDLVRWFRPGGSITPEHIANLHADLAVRMVTAR